MTGKTLLAVGLLLSVCGSGVRVALEVDNLSDALTWLERESKRMIRRRTSFS